MGKAMNREASEKETIPCGRGSPRQPALPEGTCCACAWVTLQAGGAPRWLGIRASAGMLLCQGKAPLSSVTEGC